MATSITDICNLALSRLNVDPVASLDPAKTKQERLCAIMYPISLDSTLRRQAWNFAHKEVALALVGTEINPGYLFTYTLPSDCVAARNIVSGVGRTTEIPYEIVCSDDNATKLLLTDEEDAWLAYTSNAISPTIFDSQFVEALSWKLAADLSVPFKADSQLQQSLLQGFTTVLGDATGSDASEGKQKPFESNPLREVRR